MFSYVFSALCIVNALSVRPLLTFHIFNFSSETAEQNSKKLDRKQELNVLCQVCVFRAVRKNKISALLKLLYLKTFSYVLNALLMRCPSVRC